MMILAAQMISFIQGLRILLMVWPRRGHTINEFTQDEASFA